MWFSSLRRRILLMLFPLVLLLIVVGISGVLLLQNLGRRSDEILKENYLSIRAMIDLTNAVHRLDTVCRSSLEVIREQTLREFEASWNDFDREFEAGRNNITIFPEEPRLVAQLEEQVQEYQPLLKRFFDPSSKKEIRVEIYIGTEKNRGIVQVQTDIWSTAKQILNLNQEQMTFANREAQSTGRSSAIGLTLGILFSLLVALIIGFGLVRSILKPIQLLTEAAEAVGSGKLNRNVPEGYVTELARLATTFNHMTDQLRKYRDSNTARLLRAQQSAQATIDSFPDPVLVIDPLGRVELTNRAATKTLGVSSTLETRNPLTPWVPPEPIREPLNLALRDQRDYLTETFDQAILLRFEGTEHYFLPEIHPIRDPEGNTLGAAVVLNDITKYRLLDQLKSDLVATVSHEMKTPLTNLRLAVHLLLEESIGILNPKQMELLLDARENSERLLSIIEHLLSLARLEDRREMLAIQGESVSTLFQTASDYMAPRAVAKRVEIILQDTTHVPMIAVDATRLGYALNNLLMNAITYTPPGGTVTLSAETIDNQRVRISVTDTGKGIPKDCLPHIFEKFFRVPNDPHPAGTGLGLAIVREIVLLHGGEVRCESEVDHGTIFSLILPIWKGESSS